MLFTDLFRPVWKNLKLSVAGQIVLISFEKGALGL